MGNKPNPGTKDCNENLYKMTDHIKSYGRQRSSGHLKASRLVDGSRANFFTTSTHLIVCFTQSTDEHSGQATETNADNVITSCEPKCRKSSVRRRRLCIGDTCKSFIIVRHQSRSEEDQIESTIYCGQFKSSWPPTACCRDQWYVGAAHK